MLFLRDLWIIFAAARLPAAPKKNRTAQRERVQRRARSSAGDVTARLRAGAAPGRAYIPASAAGGTALELIRKFIG